MESSRGIILKDKTLVEKNVHANLHKWCCSDSQLTSPVLQKLTENKSHGTDFTGTGPGGFLFVGLYFELFYASLSLLQEAAF